MNGTKLVLVGDGEPSVEPDDEISDTRPLLGAAGALHDAHPDLEQHEVEVGGDVGPFLGLAGLQPGNVAVPKSWVLAHLAKPLNGQIVVGALRVLTNVVLELAEVGLVQHSMPLVGGMIPDEAMEALHHLLLCATARGHGIFIGLERELDHALQGLSGIAARQDENSRHVPALVVDGLERQKTTAREVVFQHLQLDGCRVLIGIHRCRVHFSVHEVGGDRRSPGEDVLGCVFIVGHDAKLVASKTLQRNAHDSCAIVGPIVVNDV